MNETQTINIEERIISDDILSTEIVAEDLDGEVELDDLPL